MSLDRELAAAFGREAQLREVPPPDVEGLIRGGRARRRRRNVGRLCVAVFAAAVLVGVGVYVVHIDPRDSATVTSEPAAVPPPFPDLNGTWINPGTYRMFVGAGPDGVKVEADLTIRGPNWIAYGAPVIRNGDTWVGVAAYQPDALADDAPCSGAWQSRPASKNPQTLARQLVRLPRSTVVQPLRSTEAFGHDVIHVRLRIDTQCPDEEYYQVAEMSAGSRGISFGTGNNSLGVLMDVWVVDLGGTAVVVDMWRHVDASTKLEDRATQVLDSINFVMSE